jgi:hypothetical protein
MNCTQAHLSLTEIQQQESLCVSDTRLVKLQARDPHVWQLGFNKKPGPKAWAFLTLGPHEGL